MAGVCAIADDPLTIDGSQWGVYGDASSPANAYGSQAAEIWAAGATGSTSVVVGVVDSGIDYRHEDLYLNVWLNQNELPSAFRSALVDGNGDGLITFWDLNQAANAAHVADLNTNGRIDAGDLLADARWADGSDGDSNGLLDDLVGWDYANNDNDPLDDYGHGTHVAGSLGAIGGNGLGCAGVAWSVQMVALKFIGSSGLGTLNDAAQAVSYFTAASKANPTQHFVATNNSWAGGSYYSPLHTAIIAAARADILFVAAAGNAASGASPINTDTAAAYPAGYSTTKGAGYEAVISVAAIDSGGTLAGFSNYGATTVDLAAPGDGILSTVRNNRYEVWSGTSMAAPHVTGAVALYAAVDPGASAADIRATLLATTVATASLAGKTVTGGRLDVQAMVAASGQPVCFLRGTLILTSRGEVAVERLREGDLVATRFGGLRPIRWIGTQRFHPRFAGPSSTPIRFAPGSLGDGIPSADLFVSPGHAVLVGDVLVHAGVLVNGSTITQPRFEGESIDYFHLDLGGHDCVLANSAWAESYFEDHNRDSFHNAATFHARFPGHAPRRQATCLPIVPAEHPAIAMVRARLAVGATQVAA